MDIQVEWIHSSVGGSMSFDCVTTTITPHASVTSMLGTRQDIKEETWEKRPAVHVCVFKQCARLCGGKCVHVYGSFSRSTWWVSQFSTVCCYSRLHSHWIGDECGLRALQTTTMPRQSARKADRRTDRQKDGRERGFIESFDGGD